MISCMLQGGVPEGVVIPSGDIWYWLMSAIGFPVMIIAVIVIASAWGIVRWRTPQEAKQITKAAHAKKPVLLFFNDAGQAWFEPLKQINASGAASTTAKIDKQKGWLGFFPRKKDPVLQNPGSDLSGNIAADNLAEYVDALQTTKIHLKGARIPIHVAYSGKALVTSLMALAGVEFAQRLALTDGGTSVEEQVCSYCGGKQVVERKVLREAVNLTVVNITRFFKNIGKLMAWDESQERGIAIEQFEWGKEEERRKTNKSPLMMVLIALGFCFGMAILAFLVVKLL